MNDEVKESIEDYIKAGDKLVGLAKRQYSEENCPLNLGVGFLAGSRRISHRGLAEGLWGVAQWLWNCEFCGKEFQD